jgi:hypothetical protein
MRAWARGLRCGDPKLGIRWPMAVSVILEKDANRPLLALTGAA